MDENLNADATHDAYGEAILKELEPARRFSKWMFETIEPFLGDRTLEIGSGIGNISRQISVREKLTLSDYASSYRQQLKSTFGGRDLVDIIEVDLTSDESFTGIQDSYDSIVCLNVLEHIEDDQGALKRMAGALAPGGNLIILVPQYPLLMSNMDRLLGHFRRYRKAELNSKFREAGLSPIKTMNFNSLGAMGWFVSNTLAGGESLGSGKVRLFDSTVPLFKRLEKVFPLPGLSVIGVARRET